MISIIAGQHKGKRIKVPNGIRPTIGLAREALFDSLEHNEKYTPIKDKTILDLYAGTGAMGFEGLSRGAKYVTFIDNHKDSMKAISWSADNLEVNHKVDVINNDATRLKKASFAHDVLFMDAPYVKYRDIPRVLESAISMKWIHETTLIIIEAQRNVKIPFHKTKRYSFNEIGSKRYGQSIIYMMNYIVKQSVEKTDDEPIEEVA